MKIFMKTKKNKTNKTNLSLFKKSYTLKELIKMNKCSLAFTICCIIIFISAIFWSILSGICYFNSDTASINMYVREQIQEKSFFPKGWYNGEEIPIISPHLLILPLTLLNIPAYLSRQITNVIFIAILFVVIFYVIKKIFDYNTSMMANIFVFSGISASYFTYLYAQVSYAPIFFIIFFSIGLFFDSVTERLAVQNKRKFILFLFMVFFASLNGNRYFQMFTIPLIMAILTYIFFEDYMENAFWKSLWKNASKIIALMAPLMIAGYALYSLLYKSLSVASNRALSAITYTNIANILENIQKFFASYISIGGYEGNYPLLSLAGFAGLIKLCLHILFTILFPYLLAKKYKTLSHKVKIFLWYCAWNWLLIFLIFTFTSFIHSEAENRYIMFQTVLLYILSSYYISTFLIDKGRKIVMLFSTCCIIGFGVLSSFEMHFVYSGKLLRHEAQDNYESVISTLKKNHLNFGYATFWNSHTFTVMSDFDIEIAPIHFTITETETSIFPFRLLSASRVFMPEYHTGQSFLMLTKSECEEYLSENTLPNVIKTIPCKDYIIYVFNHNIIEQPTL